MKEEIPCPCSEGAVPPQQRRNQGEGRQVPGSETFLEMMDAYRSEYGFKAMYTHEFIYKTWYEDPTPAYEAGARLCQPRL